MISDSEKSRYDRQIILPGVGEEGQEKIKNISVLVVGAGGLGCPVLQYLTGAGIGKIGIIDADRVSLSNLQRQILYTEAEIGEFKAELAAQKMKGLNANVEFSVYPFFLSQDNMNSILDEYDIIVGATDNFESRYLIDAYCKANQKPFVHGSIADFEGQFSVFNFQQSPSYADVFPKHEKVDAKVVGVLGALPGIIGSYMALEVIKIASELNNVASDALYIFNGLNNRLVKLKY